MNDTEQKDGEPPKGRFAAFWTSLPGVLTAGAAFIGALAAILALFLGGGSSGDGGGESGESGASRAEWAAKVNPICSDATDAIRRLPISQQPDFSEASNYLHQVGEIARDMTAGIRAVAAPAEDQANIDRLTVLWDRQADLADAGANAVLAQDQASAESAAQQAQDASQEADTLAGILGVTSCAQVVQASFTR